MQLIEVGGAEELGGPFLGYVGEARCKASSNPGGAPPGSKEKHKVIRNSSVRVSPAGNSKPALGSWPTN